MTFNLQTILAVGLGGFLGALARAYVVHFSNKHFSVQLPLGILFVNILGSFIVGVFFALFAHINFSSIFKSFLTTGFLGALTTYSTFAIESFLLLQTSFILGLANIILNLLGTIIAAATGYKLMHYFIR